MVLQPVDTPQSQSSFLQNAKMTLPIQFRYLAAFELFPSLFYVALTLQTVYIDILHVE